MTGVMADINCGRALDRLLAFLFSDESGYAPIWAELGLVVSSFQENGLSDDSTDREVWNVCQTQRLVLVTANRNHDGPDSLEAVIREGDSSALPVLTIADDQRVLNDGGYARQAAEHLIEYLSDLRDYPDMLLGTGRLYLPKRPV